MLTREGETDKLFKKNQTKSFTFQLITETSILLPVS